MLQHTDAHKNENRPGKQPVNIDIRDANPADAAIIAEFNTRLAAETEDTVLDPAVIDAGVAAALADSNKARYWVAVDDGRVVGQIMVTYEWSDWRNGMLWWIQSVYVAGSHRRLGVFSALYRHVESLARQDPAVRGIRLYVENRNQHAQTTYEALGMVGDAYRVMENLFDD